jgi:hypothetical protein
MPRRLLVLTRPLRQSFEPYGSKPFLTLFLLLMSYRRPSLTCSVRDQRAPLDSTNSHDSHASIAMRSESMVAKTRKQVPCRDLRMTNGSLAQPGNATRLRLARPIQAAEALSRFSTRHQRRIDSVEPTDIDRCQCLRDDPIGENVSERQVAILQELTPQKLACYWNRPWLYDRILGPPCR